MSFEQIAIIIPLIFIIVGFFYLIKHKRINLFRLFNEHNKMHIEIKTKIIVITILGCFALICGEIKGILNIKESYYNIIWGFLFVILLYLGGTVLTKK